MEAEAEVAEQVAVSNVPEDGPDKEITTDDEQISLDTTIHVENSSLKSIPLDNGDIEKQTSEVNSENGKKKCKEEKPPTKIVVRRLPPTMTKDGFLEQVSPVPELDYMYYVQGDTNYGVQSFSRAYLNFVNQDDLFSFSATFDNYVFLDSKGQEFPAIVEFAMFQRVPKMRSKKKDPLMGSIESDPTFITFKETLLAEALENSKPGGKTIKQHYFETEISTTEEVNTTPLLEYLKVRRAEKARMREERREEKKRKELERKMKQKKDKKGGEEASKEEDGKDVKIQQKPPEKNEKEIEKNKENLEHERAANFDKPSELRQYIGGDRKDMSPGQEMKISILLNPDKDKSAFREKLSNCSPPAQIIKTENDKNSSDAESLSKSMSGMQKSETKSSLEIQSKEKTEKPVSQLSDVQRMKEAEQQTIYLRKLLGLLPGAAQPAGGASEATEDKKKDVITTSKLVEPPEEVITAFKEYMSANRKAEILWSRHNINPALPSASFKTSGCTIDGGSESSENEAKISRNEPWPTGSKGEEVLQGKERRDGKDREGRNGRKKDDREKVKETRPREFKSRGGKSYQEERLKLAERREEQKKREMLSADKKYENTEGGDIAETGNEQAKGGEDRPQRGGDRKRYEHKKGGKYDNEDWKEEGKKRGRTERNMGRRDRKEDTGTSRRGPDKKNGECDSRRRGGKSYNKSLEQRSSGMDKRKLAATENIQTKAEDSKEAEVNKEEVVTPPKRCRSVDDISQVGASGDSKPTNDEEASSATEPEPKRRSSSLGRLPSEGDVRRNTEPHNSSNTNEDIVQEKEARGDRKGADIDGRFSAKKDSSVKRYSSERSRKKGGNCKSDESQESSCSEMVRNRTQDCKSETEGSSRSAKEAARTERRIRNKDRPSIELYRPGMGKFSKQRLEKEKTLGSSTEVDSPSHSPSPTPRASNKPNSPTV